MNEAYIEQTRLMLRVMPHVSKEVCFALKGGTAINFFVRDMPRLSVDIDLVYLPIDSRAEALSKIDAALKRIKGNILRAMRGGIKIQEGLHEGFVIKLFINGPGGIVKVEVSPVLRGIIGKSSPQTVSKKVQDTFDLAASIQTVPTSDLYGGKICAALDRQHPRDLFDIKVLLANEGITTDIRMAFIVYLASHSRPMHEVIVPNRENIQAVYETHFLGMTDEPVTPEELTAARETLIMLLKHAITASEKQFLVSITEGKPDWKLMDMPGIEKLPAIQWKLQNIAKMDKAKLKDQLGQLKAKLGV